MNKINVVNIRNNSNAVPTFYCGRGSALGNTYTHRGYSKYNVIKVKDRATAIRRYAEDWESNLEDEDKLTMFLEIYAFHKRGEINLSCYCYPKDCHCDVIKQKLLEYDIENT